MITEPQVKYFSILEFEMQRKVDKLVKKGSFADRLRMRRMAIESGDPTGRKVLKKKKAKKSKSY